MQLLEAFTHLGVIMPDTMEATLVKCDHPAVAKLLEYRAHEKTLSAFGENVLSLINPVTGRIHPDFNQYRGRHGPLLLHQAQCPADPVHVRFPQVLHCRPGIQAGDL